MRKMLKQKISDQIVLDWSAIEEAKIGQEVEVIIQEGAIFVLPVVKQEAWKLLGSLGEDAIEGVLDSPSEKHNQYLYGGRI